ncbi:MAG: hypothetical protein M0Z66_08585 [Thermaerobacter sp.]|nr:hypothetical protein [Thermaerobacter sp.]
MFRLMPDLSDDLLLRLYHKGAHVGWTSDDIDWQAPVELSDRESEALARVLSPVYLGEQSAMLGAANVLPQLALAGEATGQLYLSTFLLDEARHFEVLTRLYHRLQHDPIAIRKLPAMLRYHHRLRQGDRVDWVFGILVSDLFAKQFYQLFSKTRQDALFGDMSQRILIDESRHQAFCDEYLSRALPKLSPQRRTALRDMRDELLRIMQEMQDALGADAEVLGFSGDDMLARVAHDIEMHSRRIGLDGGPDGGGSGTDPSRDPDPVDLAARRAQREKSQSEPLQSAKDDCDGCGTCALAAICESRIVRRAVGR